MPKSATTNFLPMKIKSILQTRLKSITNKYILVVNLYFFNVKILYFGTLILSLSFNKYYLNIKAGSLLPQAVQLHLDE